MTSPLLAVLKKTNLVLMVKRVHKRKFSTAMLATATLDAIAAGLGPLARLQSLLSIDDILGDQEVLAIGLLLVLRE